MRKTILIAVLFFVSCTTVRVVRHPDYLFPPNLYPQSIKIYPQGLYPNDPFIIIGLVDIDVSWTISETEATGAVQEKVASIGGQGVILADTQIDVLAFNRSVTTRGQATFQGNQVNYYAVQRDNTLYVPIVKVYGYVIRWSE